MGARGLCEGDAVSGTEQVLAILGALVFAYAALAATVLLELLRPHNSVAQKQQIDASHKLIQSTS